jgi:DNA-binding NarL/FixJ family response regulator
MLSIRGSGARRAPAPCHCFFPRRDRRALKHARFATRAGLVRGEVAAPGCRSPPMTEKGTKTLMRSQLATADDTRVITDLAEPVGTGTIRVVLADDHTLLRAGLRALLQRVPGIAVVGESANGHDALSLVREHRPDVLISDIAMPGLNGLELALRVKEDGGPTRVVILSMHSSEEYVCQALRAGASGYLLKDSGTAELEIAVRAVARGETYLSPGVSRVVIAVHLDRTNQQPSELDAITPRQREILRLIANGLSTKAIARALGISTKTVETHRTQLMDRLGIHDIANLVRLAIRVGLVDEA